MRFFIVFISVVYVSFFSLAQPYGNEWINYNQKYYQFPVVEDGIYRISYQSLIDAGIPVASIAANKIQVFGKQKEIPLYIQDNGDNSIDAGDYIEFFAEKNDRSEEHTSE